MTTQTWWGKFDFQLDQARVWDLAGLLVRINRSRQEWQIEQYRPVNQHEDYQDWSIDERGLALSSVPATLSRYLFNHTESLIEILPQVADRSVVVKPINPLYIPAGQQTTLFVSTPLWACIKTENTLLADIPVVRPSDTWFGTTPTRGEVCYSTQVLGRTDLDLLPIRAFRAVTPVELCNDGDDTLLLERINLPVCSLDLYTATDGRLWTPSLIVERQVNSRLPRVRIDRRIHPSAGVVRRVNQARHADEATLSRMFDLFFD